MKKIKISLLMKLILAIIIGIAIGSLKFIPLIRAMITFSGVFGNFLQFVIPLIILGFVTPGIGDLGKKAGKILAITTLLAYISTIYAGGLSYIIDTNLFNKFLESGALAPNLTDNKLLPFMSIKMPPIMDVTTSLIMAFILGVGISLLEDNAIKKVMYEFQIIVENVISKIIIPLLPYHIAGIFAKMTYEGKSAIVLGVFPKVFLVIILLHAITLLTLFGIAGFLNKISPFYFIKNMLPAYFTAIGTQSSAATIPVTLKQTEKNGVHKSIAEFVIPLCANIHLSGSIISITSSSIALMIMNSKMASPSKMIGFIFILGITMIAAPGVPGGAVVSALGILQSVLGFDKEMLDLIMALHLAQDSFGTACNITGDGALAIIVNKIAGYRIKKENTLNVTEKEKNM